MSPASSLLPLLRGLPGSLQLAPCLWSAMLGLDSRSYSACERWQDERSCAWFCWRRNHPADLCCRNTRTAAWKASTRGSPTLKLWRQLLWLNARSREREGMNLLVCLHYSKGCALLLPAILGMGIARRFAGLLNQQLLLSRGNADALWERSTSSLEIKPGCFAA
jgi:hypothetical protein